MKYPELKGKCKEYIEKEKCLRLCWVAEKKIGLNLKNVHIYVSQDNLL